MSKLQLIALTMCLAVTTAHGADIAISALPAASSVAGADVVPIVQTGTTKKATFTVQKSLWDSFYQPLDGDLTAISALTGTHTIYYRSAASTWSPVTIGNGLNFTGATLAANTPTPTPTATPTATATATATATPTPTPTPTATPDVSDTSFGSSWDGVTTFAPSKNAVYDRFHLLDSTDNGLITTRIVPRVTTITSSATPTINTDNCDAVTITALAVAITSMTTNLSGSPNNFDKLIIRFKDDGTARGITWGASFASSQATLPTTTVISKVLTVGLIWDSVKLKWVCLATDQEP